MYRGKRFGRESPSPPYISKRSRSNYALTPRGRWHDEPENVCLTKSSDTEAPRSRTTSGDPRHLSSGHHRRGVLPEHHYSSITPSSAAVEVTRPHQHYKVLCISSLHPKASDEMVKDILFGHFRKFDNIRVKIVNEPNERLAYVYFQSYEDARNAKHSSKSKFMIYDKPVVIEKAYDAVATSPSISYEKPRQSEPDYPGRYYSGSGSGYLNSRKKSESPPPFFRGSGHPGGQGQAYRLEFTGTRGGRYGGEPGPGFQPPFYNRGPPAPMRANFYRRNGPSGGPQPQFTNPRSPAVRPPGGMRCPPMNPYNGGAMATTSFVKKKDKFNYPNYLEHLSPEDDPLATRTLFVGNLDRNIEKEAISLVFTKFGTVEDIDIKYPSCGYGSVFAFVRFANLDMAARAKTEVSGQYIGKNFCKIGYGKVTATTTIWIGGLGNWTSLNLLQREFDRFGAIKNVEWNEGDTQAIITYDNIDAAKAAVKDMRGYPLGGSDHRIRTDFAGVEEIAGYANSGNLDDDGLSLCDPRGNSDRRRSPTCSGSDNGNEQNVDAPVYPTAATSGQVPETDRPLTRDGISDMIQTMSVAWQGTFFLRNNASYAVKLHKIDGELEAIYGFLTDDMEKSQLTFTRKLRLNQIHLDEVRKLMMSKRNSTGIFLAIPNSIEIESRHSQETNASALLSDSGPLMALVEYFKDKGAAGILDFKNRELLRRGQLYAFYPCDFSYELLQKSMPGLEEEVNEDHLVIVAVSEYWDGKDKVDKVKD